MEQVTEAFKPPQHAVNAVLDWLHSSGILRDKVTHSDNKQWLVFSCSTEQAENLFHTDYYEYHDLHGRSLAGNEGYHLPREISDFVDFVKPGVVAVPLRLSKRSPGAYQRRAKLSASQSQPEKELDQLRASKVQRLESKSNCTNEITPECLTRLLNMPFLDGNPGPDSPNSFGTYQLGQYFEQADLDLFYNEFFSSRIPRGYGPNFASIDGGLRYEQLEDWSGNGGTEVSLDLQATIPLYYPGNVTNIQVDDEYYGQDRDPALLTPLLDAIDGSYCKSCAYGICGPFDPVSRSNSTDYEKISENQATGSSRPDSFMQYIGIGPNLPEHNTRTTARWTQLLSQHKL